MPADCMFATYNGHAFDVAQLPTASIDAFRRTVIDGVASGCRLSALFVHPYDGSMQLVAVLADAEAGTLGIATTAVAREYPALTPDCPQAHWFEREIFEQWRVRPIGHPWLKPVRFELPRCEEASAGEAPPVCGVTDFFQMEGEETHEVAVGPVHAGIIEPGHFRFQCHGETVHHLEISLGYQHRGIERALVGGPNRRTIHYMETLAGDTTIGHATAYCRMIEALSKTHLSARVQVIRGVAMELERIANHIGDLGALAGDVGFLPTMSYCGRIRGDVLNVTAALCGNRFGRGLVRPGGVGFDLSPPVVADLLHRLASIAKDADGAVNLLWNAPSVTARFDQTGTVSMELCQRLGLVGVAARASGVACDVRRDFPYGIFRFTHIPVSTWDTGDVFARAYVRWLEVQRSLAFVIEQLQALPEGRLLAPTGPLAANQMAAGLVEGWRGEICHVAITDRDGKFACYKVVDPSLHNWFGLAMAMRDEQISDFPLCNKSFNLSYCGHDL